MLQRVGRLLHLPIVDIIDTDEDTDEYWYGEEMKSGLIDSVLILTSDSTPRLSSLTNAMKWYITFGGMDMNKIYATGKLLGFDVSGEYFKIREFMAARSKRQ